MATAQHDRRDEIQTVTIVFLILAWISVSLRCWVRIGIIKTFAIDDWLMVLALLCFTVYCSFVFVGVHSGFGQHYWTLGRHGVSKGLEAFFHCEIWFTWTTLFMRLSVGLALLRFSSSKWQRYIVHTVNAINVSVLLFWFVWILAQCQPISYNWTIAIGAKDGHCIRHNISIYMTFLISALSIFVDWVFGLLPVSIIWHLKIDAKKKALVWLILGFGALASIATIIRTPYVVSIVELNNAIDFLWVFSDVVIWTSVECGVGITAISLATLRPLVGVFMAAYGRNDPGDDSARGQPANQANPLAAGRPQHQSVLSKVLRLGRTTPSINLKSSKSKSSGGSEETSHALISINETAPLTPPPHEILSPHNADYFSEQYRHGRHSVATGHFPPSYP